MKIFLFLTFFLSFSFQSLDFLWSDLLEETAEEKVEVKEVDVEEEYTLPENHSTLEVLPAKRNSTAVDLCFLFPSKILRKRLSPPPDCM